MTTKKEETKKTSTPKKSTTSKRSEKEQVVYVGPNLNELTTYTVFKSDVPVHVKSLIAKVPSVEKLLVPVKDLAKAREATQKKGTLEHRHYKKVIESLGEDE